MLPRGQERLLRALPALGKCRILLGHVFLRFPPLLSTGRCSEFFLFRPSRLRLPAKAVCRLGISHTHAETNIKSEQSDVPEMILIQIRSVWIRCSSRHVWPACISVGCMVWCLDIARIDALLGLVLLPWTLLCCLGDRNGCSERPLRLVNVGDSTPPKHRVLLGVLFVSSFQAPASGEGGVQARHQPHSS